jgi:hypothetical protein
MDAARHVSPVEDQGARALPGGDRNVQNRRLRVLSPPTQAPEQVHQMPRAARQLRSGVARVCDWAQTPHGRIWVDAAVIWALTRAVFLVLTFLVPDLFGRAGGSSTSLAAALDRWVAQDGSHFAYIAAHGYTDYWRTAFWPAYPALMHVFGPLFGGDYGLAGMAITNVAFFGALVALRRLAERELDADAGRRAALYLAVFPTAFYFFAPYSEAVFLFLGISSFAAMRERRWLLAGLLGCAATLTRSAGVLLVVPFAVEFYSAWRAGAARWWRAVYVALIPAAAGLYSLYLVSQHRSPITYLSAQQYWGRSLQWPWTTYVLGLQGLLHLGGRDPIGATHLALNFAALVVFVMLAVVSFRVLPPSFGLYTAALLLYLSLFPASDPVAAVQGEGRLVLMAFPIFMALGKWGRRTWVHEALLVGMLPLLAIACAHFLLHLEA